MTTIMSLPPRSPKT